MPRRSLISAAALALAISLSGCAGEVSQRGFMMDAELKQGIRPGVDNQSSVAETLGRPTAMSDFGGDIWYYISMTEKRKSFFQPEVLDQEVFAVRFGEDGLVSHTETFTLADALNVNPVDRKTPTRGKELGLLEQLFGNIGRFSGSTQNPQGYQN